MHLGSFCVQFMASLEIPVGFHTESWLSVVVMLSGRRVLSHPCPSAFRTVPAGAWGAWSRSRGWRWGFAFGHPLLSHRSTNAPTRPRIPALTQQPPSCLPSPSSQFPREGWDTDARGCIRWLLPSLEPESDDTSAEMRQRAGEKKRE